ncbi:MAG: hypothetical protein ACPGTU_06300 [Myxococcota bacterium]
MACGLGPADGVCEDAECRQEMIMSQWASDPQRAVQAVKELPDVIEQVAVVSALTDQFPGQVGPLCRQLPRGISRDRCLEMNARPHLWNERETVQSISRAGSGPASSYLLVADVPMSELIDVRGDPRVCAGEIDPHSCVWKQGIEYAREGDVEEAAKSCASVRTSANNAQTWRYECFFSVAEAHIQKWGRSRYQDTLALCGASGTFRAECITHTLTVLAQRVPSSDVGEPLVWAEHRMRSHDVSRAWKDSPLRADILDKFWALSTAFSVSKSKGLSGDALDVIPLTAHRHLRAAVAWHLLQDEPPTDDDLITYAERLTTILDRRHQREDVVDPEYRFEGVQDLWPVDREGEAHLSAISYLGNSRRTVAGDPMTDAAICILEAAARSKTPHQSLIEMGGSHPDERVRWTASRLQERLQDQELAQRSSSGVPPSPGFTRPGPVGPK